MQLHDTTQADILYLADHTVSRGCFKDQPEETDYIYTLMHENEILGIGGIKIINPTTAWVWADATDKVYGKGIKVIKIIRRTMEWLAKTYRLHRLQAYIEMDFPAAIRMVEHLGFEKECTLKEFVGDKDVYLYTRFF